MLGIAVVGALLSTAALTLLERGKGASFYFALAATLCVALSLIVFFSVAFPANKATQNWTVLPEGGRCSAASGSTLMPRGHSSTLLLWQCLRSRLYMSGAEQTRDEPHSAMRGGGFSTIFRVCGPHGAAELVRSAKARADERFSRVAHLYSLMAR